MLDRRSYLGLQVEGRSTLASVAVGFAELFVGLFANSIALLSDGISSILDSVVSIIIWLGLKFAKKGRDERFHFGYYKVETFSSITASILMLVIALWIIYESYVSLIERSSLNNVPLAATVALFAAVPSFYLGYTKRRVAKSIRSASVSLDSYNSIIGGIASLVAFCGILASGLGIFWGDAVGGILIAGLIFTTAYSALKEGSLVLMDACVCTGALETIEGLAKGVVGVEGIHDIRLRRAGPYIAGEVHLEVDGNITVYRADEIAAEVERLLRNSLDDLNMITVKVESKKAK